MKRFFAIFALFFAGILWLVGGIFIWAGVSAHNQAAQLAKGPTSLSGLKAGDEFRFDAQLRNDNQQVSLHQKQACVAYQFRVYEVTRTVVHGEDEEEEEKLEHHLVLERRKGPQRLTFASGDSQILIPLESWRPNTGNRFELDPEEGADYQKELPRPGPRFWYHEGEEACLESQARYALVGRVQKIREGEVLASAEQPVQVIEGTLEAARQKQSQSSKILMLVGASLVAFGFVLGAGLYMLLKRFVGTNSPT